ncbi:MAG TPA: RNA polymerase sigma factor [Candidatus Scatomorpha intestinavium]|uniref:RNA polymerase sigma factor n=1 Tax=Candidatus Scatomorpha intestinavium TaxID=2840922 RepID=A0A9D0ZF45_9FIRM|nr:RNA polymerase sigma factor [Candidatus Scatomorpha intestinavium]
MKRMKSGADEPFDAAYLSHHDKMFRLAYRMLGSREKAEDLVQDTFVLALFNRQRFETHPNQEGYLMVALKNMIFNELRKSEYRLDVPLDGVPEPASREPDAPLESILPAQLSEEDKQLLIWRFEKQLSYREISGRLGISEAGCRSRVSRAVARCRKYFEENEKI